jgi:hypothetical protein
LVSLNDVTFVFTSIHQHDITKHNLDHNHVADLHKLNRQAIPSERKPKGTEDLPVRFLKIVNQRLATWFCGQHIDQWCSTCGPPWGIMRLAGDHLNAAHGDAV